MAVFNPQVQPTNDPNYLNYSKPISDIPADKSTGMLLATLGEVLDSGTKVADTITKDVIGKEVQDKVDITRDLYTGLYKNVATAQAQGTIPDPTSAAAAGMKVASLVPGEEAEVPGGVSAGVERAQQLGSALNQNRNKANDTLYTGALNALTKSLRNQYPGYRDYIDQKIAEVSGINPANAYMQNLLQDINRNAVGTKSEVDRTIAWARQYIGSDTNMPAYIEAVRNNLPGAIQNLEKRVNEVASDEWKFKEWERQRKVKDSSQSDTRFGWSTWDQTRKMGVEVERGDETWSRGTADYNRKVLEQKKADDLEVQKDQFARQIRSSAYRQFDAIVQIPGLSQPENIQRMIDDARAGKQTLTPDQHTGLLNAATLAYDTWKREAVKIQNEYGYSSKIPDIKARNDIIENEGRFFQDQIKAINDKEYGTLFNNKRYADNATSTTQRQLLDDGDMGRYWQTVSGVRAIGGDNWANYLQGKALQQGVPGYLTNFMTKTTLGMSTPRVAGEPAKSLTDDIKRVKAANINPATRIYDELVNNTEVLKAGPVPGMSAEQWLNAGKNMVNYLYDTTRNSDLMKQFQRDFVDSKGNTVRGKFDVFNKIYDQKIIDNVWKMGDKDSWDKLKNTQRIQFHELFGEEVSHLNSIQGDGALPVKLRWDTDTNRIIPEFGKATTNVEANYMNWAKDSVTKLNRGLASLAYTHSKEGDNTSEYLFQTLMQLGYSPNDRLHGDNLPQRVIEAIAASVKKKEEKK